MTPRHRVRWGRPQPHQHASGWQARACYFAHAVGWGWIGGWPLSPWRGWAHGGKLGSPGGGVSQGRRDYPPHAALQNRSGRAGEARAGSTGINPPTAGSSARGGLTDRGQRHGGHRDPRYSHSHGRLWPRWSAHRFPGGREQHSTGPRRRWRGGQQVRTPQHPSLCFSPTAIPPCAPQRTPRCR